MANGVVRLRQSHAWRIGHFVGVIAILGLTSFGTDAQAQPGLSPRPSESDAPPDSSHSSGPDSTGALEFPFSITIAPGNLLIWNGEVFDRGDVLQLEFDPQARVMRVNSQLWQSFTPPVPNPNESGKRRASWLSNLAAAYRRIKLTSGYPPPSDEETLSMALRQVGAEGLDASRPPRVYRNRMFVWFSGAPVAYTVSIIETVPVATPPDSAEVVAAATLIARELRDWLSQSEVPYVLVHNTFGQVEHFWEAAREIEALVSAASERALTPDETEAAARLGIRTLLVAPNGPGQR